MKYPTIDKIVLNQKQKDALVWLYNNIPKDEINRSFMVGFFPKEEDFWKIEKNLVDEHYWTISQLSSQLFQIMSMTNDNIEKRYNCPLIKDYQKEFGLLPKYLETLLESNGIKLKEI